MLGWSNARFRVFVAWADELPRILAVAVRLGSTGLAGLRVYCPGLGKHRVVLEMGVR